MKKVVFFVAAACLAASVFAQGEASPFAVTRIQTQITAQTPKGLPFGMEPSGNINDEAGYEFAYLVTGEKIADIKKGSLSITKLQMQDGTDISKTSKGTPAYKLGAFTKVSNDGKYARFGVQVTPDKVNPMELPALEGSVILYIADGTKTEVLKMKTDDHQNHIVGAYKISLSHEKGVGLGVRAEGPENGIVTIDVMADGQRLENRGVNSFSTFFVSDKQKSKESFITYRFDEPSSEDITINLTLKSLKEHTVTF